MGAEQFNECQMFHFPLKELYDKREKKGGKTKLKKCRLISIFTN